MYLGYIEIMCFIPFQCLFVGHELNLANKFIAKVISGLVQLARYMSAPIALDMALQSQDPLHYLP